ncbi:hypothetical protein KAW04_00320 [Candidatus Bathyarchaeota archaeon]|nr:hypothetical protein [Candidatus Bathyarchaeota archaeon]
MTDKRHEYRKKHIRQIKVLIKSKNDDVGIDTVLSKYMLNEGISLRKIREYIKILLLSGELEPNLFDKSNLIKRV